MKATQIIKVGIISSVLGAVAILPGGASAAQTWQAHAGSGLGQGLITVMRFYPDTITIDEGDAITWTVQGDAHTIAFLSGATPPSPFSPQAQQPSGGNSYNGTGFVNSGIIAPGSSYTLTFTKAGTYQYNCLLHPGMMATVVVQPAGTAYPHPQRYYDQAFQTARAQDIAQGAQLFSQITPPKPTANTDGSKNYSVNVGLGNGMASVMRFFMKSQVIHVGDTVTWTNRDPMMPHTVTFPGSDGVFQEIFTPAGSSSYDGSTFTSAGVLMPGQSYTLKFTKAGRFNYECLLHDDLGMKGTIVVTR